MDIKKLKYPLWLNIIYFALTTFTPILVVLVQGLTSPSPTYRILFTSILILLFAWLLVRKFFVRPFEEQLNKEKIALEHDYSIEVGNGKKIEYLWYNNELKLSLFNAVQVILIGLTIIFIAVGINNATYNIKGTSFLVISLYLIAFAMKMVYLLANRDKYDKSNTQGDINETTKTSN